MAPELMIHLEDDMKNQVFELPRFAIAAVEVDECSRESWHSTCSLEWTSMAWTLPLLEYFT